MSSIVVLFANCSVHLIDLLGFSEVLLLLALDPSGGPAQVCHPSGGPAQVGHPAGPSSVGGYADIWDWDHTHVGHAPGQPSVGQPVGQVKSSFI